MHQLCFCWAVYSIINHVNYLELISLNVWHFNLSFSSTQTYCRIFEKIISIKQYTCLKLYLIKSLHRFNDLFRNFISKIHFNCSDLSIKFVIYVAHERNFFFPISRYAWHMFSRTDFVENCTFKEPYQFLMSTH